MSGIDHQYIELAAACPLAASIWHLNKRLVQTSGTIRVDEGLQTKGLLMVPKRVQEALTIQLAFVAIRNEPVSRRSEGV